MKTLNAIIAAAFLVGPSAVRARVGETEKEIMARYSEPNVALFE